MKQRRMAEAIIKLTKETVSLTFKSDPVAQIPAESKRDIDADSAKFIEADSNRKKQIQAKKVRFSPSVITVKTRGSTHFCALDFIFYAYVTKSLNFSNTI